MHAVYLYLSVTASTTLNLACWTALVAFVYSTWVNRIWPEIRVPIPEDERPDSESFTPMHPDCLSGPEVQRKLAAVRDELYKNRSSRKTDSHVREKVFWKSYSLENRLRESIFREDLFLYNCLQGPGEGWQRRASSSKWSK